jgi:hypothetical protein
VIRDLAVVLALARGRVWELAGAPDRVTIDLDATLITAHSEKEYSPTRTGIASKRAHRGRDAALQPRPRALLFGDDGARLGP